MTSALLILLKICVVALIFAIGMDSTLADAGYLLRRPALLARSLLAMYVFVPLVVFCLMKFLTLSNSVEAALLVLAVSAGAPLLPRKLGTLHGNPYAFSLVLITSLLATVLVPAWVALLDPEFPVGVRLSPGIVAVILAKAFFLPLAFGMVFRKFWPKAARQLEEWMLRLAGIGLLVCAVLLIVIHWQFLLDLGLHGIAVLVGVMLVALAIGHALGGPAPDDRTALAVACATRHVGIAVLVAGAFKGSQTLVPILAYLIASAIVTIPYIKWRKRPANTEGYKG